MVIKVYTSGISGNKEVKKRQQRIMMILESKSIQYEPIDITEPGNEEEKQFMQGHAESKGMRNPLPPQIFNESEYCGDYDGFDLANENDVLEEFLKLPIPAPKVNGEPVSPPLETQAESEKIPENLSDKDSNHINYEIRHEEIIEKLVAESDDNIDEPIKHLNEDEEMEEAEEEEMEEEEDVTQEPDSMKDSEMKGDSSEIMVEGEE